MRAAHNQLEMTVLSERQKKILDFCAGGKKSNQIAQKLGLARTSVYNELRTLQRIGLMLKTVDHKRRGVPATFVTIGYEPQLDDLYERAYDPALVNVEFIRTGHNIFARAAT
jgi:DNA-binding CsgD family transcriptional regulator